MTSLEFSQTHFHVLPAGTPLSCTFSSYRKAHRDYGVHTDRRRPSRCASHTSGPARRRLADNCHADPFHLNRSLHAAALPIIQSSETSDIESFGYPPPTLACTPANHTCSMTLVPSGPPASHSAAQTLVADFFRLGTSCSACFPHEWMKGPAFIVKRQCLVGVMDVRPQLCGRENPTAVVWKRGAK